MRTFVELAATSLAGLATVTPDPQLLALDPAFTSRCDDSSHHMGGMKMHASPRQGCVDEQLRLHGTRNAYVCSSAAFPHLRQLQPHAHAARAGHPPGGPPRVLN